MTGYVRNEALEATARAMGRVGTYLWERGWAERNAGNLSEDVTDRVDLEGVDLSACRKVTTPVFHAQLAGRCFLITGTGVRLRDVEGDPVGSLLLVRVEVDLTGFRVIHGGMSVKSRPTSEFPSHLEIHSALRKAGRPYMAVVHTHPTELIALSHIPAFDDPAALNDLLWNMHPEVKVVLPDGIGRVPYRCPGTMRLAEATVEVLGDQRLCLWERHGAVAVGRDVTEAFDLIDVAAKAAKIYLAVRSAGFDPTGIGPENLAELDREFGDRWKDR